MCAVAVKTRSKAQQAYLLLKRHIQGGAFAPGEQISVAQVARELGLGTTPVREAFLRAESEKLLQGDGPYSRRTVCLPEKNEEFDEIDIDRVIQKLELRSAILAATAAMAARNMTYWQFEHLKELVEEYRSKERRDGHMLFIHYLVVNCGNPCLLKIWEQNQLGYMAPKTRELGAKLEEAYRKRRSSDEPLLDLRFALEPILAHDADKAATLMRKYHDQFIEALRMIKYGMIQGEGAPAEE